MKVLEAFGEPITDGGGQDSFVFGIIDKIDMTDLYIDCLTAYECRSERYKKLVSEKGGQIYSLDLPFNPGKSRQNIKEPFAAFLRKHQYDVIHIHSGSISVLNIMSEVADKEGVKKVIVHSHSTGDRDDLKHKLLRKISSISMKKHVDIFCACSKQAALWKFEPEIAEKAIIIKNGIDIAKYEYDSSRRELWRSKLGYSNEIVIGNVGRLTYQKNQTFLVELLELLNKKNPNYRLLLVGEGEDREVIEHLAKEKKLMEKVTLAGTVTNVEDYLQAMDIFAFPSRFEGLGIVAIEAQAAGLHVLASTAVPHEAAVSDCMDFLNLELNSWSSRIEYVQMCPRKDNLESLRAQGYDVESTTKMIRNLYFR